MTDCSICKEEGKKVPAIMYCANCGRPICQAHTVHGRYCSERCYREHQLNGASDKTETIKPPHRRNTALWLGGAILFLLVFAATYYLAPYLVSYLTGT